MKLKGRSGVIVFILALGFIATGQWVLWEQNFEAVPLSQLDSVKQDVDWYYVDRAWFYNEPAEVRAFPSGSRALYFGKIDKGKGTYEGAENMENDHTLDVSPRLPPSGYALDDHAWVRVSFKYLREVEYWPWGTFDETRASIDNIAFFNMSSKDPSEKRWKTFVSEPLEPDSIQTVRFVFNPHDASHNDYFGWLIDDVKVEAVVVITASTLAEGTVGKEYYSELGAEGGVLKWVNGQRKYKWKVEGLPEGLRLGEEVKNDKLNAVITGTPIKAGVYQVKVTVTDYASEASAGRYPDSSHTRIYTLVIKPTGEASHALFSENFENGDGPNIPGWTRTGLWHRTNTVIVQGVNICDSYVAYFGKMTTPPNYDVGRRAYGELTSPKWNVADRRGQEVRISFSSWREVESYPAGGYDKTYVQIRFDEGEWRTVWYKDSKDPPPITIAWTYEVVSPDGDSQVPIVVPSAASTMQIRFVFDSVDGINNNYVGWLIDDVKVELKAGELKIVTTRLPPGEVSVYYEHMLQAHGGTPPYDWTTESRLPGGLRLERNGKLCGTPEEEGEFEVLVKVKDQEENEVSATLILVIGEKTLLFYEDFQEELDKWVPENLGLWHRTDQVKGINLTKYGYVAYYGKDDMTNPNYSTGTRTLGYLTSKEFALDGATAFKLEFDYWREVEYYTPGGYDKTYVEVRFLAGTTWSQWYRIWSKDSAHSSERAWTKVSVDPYNVQTGSTKMQIRFAFDSVDRFYNNYVGWLIDNISVKKETRGRPLPTSLVEPLVKPRGDFTVFNVPNPVRDVHTTTFLVRGVEADLIRVEVYDLSGRLVYVGEAPGNELTWHTQDMLGQYLANGVYLYKVYVKVGDTWIVSDIRKLVILR